MKKLFRSLHGGSRYHKFILFTDFLITVGAVGFFAFADGIETQLQIFINWMYGLIGVNLGGQGLRSFTPGSTALAKAKAEGVKGGAPAEPILPTQPEPQTDSINHGLQKEENVIRLKRTTKRPDRTLGRLYVPGLEILYTVEDPVREEKIAGETAIWAGRYKLGIRKEDTPLTLKFRTTRDWFAHFIEILDIEKFSKVYIHSGNTPGDTAGCPLVGYGHTPNGDVTNSNLAMRRLYEFLYPRLEAGEEWFIDIADDFE